MGRPVRNEDHWLWIGGPVPRGSMGLTLGSLVIVRTDAAFSESFAELLRHERVHVRQFREHGAVGFVVRYVGSYLKSRLRGYGHWAAYRKIPFEAEAVFLARLDRDRDIEHASSPLPASRSYL
jgi:hypothetical protein